MDGNCAVFGHRQQLHWNGKLYNNKPILKNTSKNRSIRDRFWCWRHSIACYNVQFLGSYFQCGGLALETIHGNFKRWFYHWMKPDGQGLYRAAAWQYLLTLKANRKRIGTISDDCATTDKNTTWNTQWVDELFLHYDQTTSLLRWKNKHLSKKQNNGHGYSFFADINPNDMTPYIGGML